MVRPYLNQQQRLEIKQGTLSGHLYLMDLAVQKLRRDEYEKGGYVAMKKTERNIVRLTNLKLLGVDSPKKWYQLF